MNTTRQRGRAATSRVRITSSILSLVACVALAALVGPAAAQASDASVRSAIENTGKQIKESPELKEAFVELKTEPKTLTKLQTALKAFKEALNKAIVTVSAQKASTPKGEQGETDWLEGAHKLLGALDDVSTAVTKLQHHEKAAAKAELLKTKPALQGASTKVKAGKALLGVKSTSS
jgi:Skp family chaperone for outer membrane proteins